MNKAIHFIQVWKSNQNGWAYLTGGVSPCLGVGQHHGTEPKIALIYEPMESNRRDDSHAHSKTGESAK